jgi:hypothetical protein
MTTSAAVATHRWTTAEYDRSVEGGVFHPEARLEVYREPETETYRVRLRLDASEEIAPVIRPDRKIAVRDLLP